LPKDLSAFDWVTHSHSLRFRCPAEVDLQKHFANAYSIALRNAAFPVISPENHWRIDAKDPTVLLSSGPVSGLNMKNISSDDLNPLTILISYSIHFV